METSTPRFTEDNTAGYTKAQLAELNRRFEARLAGSDDEDRAEKSHVDHVAEQVLAEFDTEQSIV